MNKYTYIGPGVEFGSCISDNWTATTFAISEKKAKSNFKYQFKKTHNLLPNVKIDLPGVVKMIAEI